ncbi:MAG: ATP-dependent sacrificial sulfur transferase LarE [Deltaproteobacteria bacterium]|nr:ATP-dependent sacrificial sulfur transferase LarE [Deltaproteobacteria bacterium]
MIGVLEDYLREIGEVTTAYSGGVDSTFLLAMSARILGKEKVVALTIQSPLAPPWELEFARNFCRARGIKHLLLDGSFILKDARITTNSSQRCYFCKRRLLEAVLREKAADQPLLTGTNASDESDLRPGMRAEEEMGILTPLRAIGCTKEAIREHSQRYGIPGFERAPSACFATRIPYGEPITIEKIRKIEAAETFLHQLGFKMVRARLIAGDTARIEVATEEIEKATNLYREIAQHLRTFGFNKVILDGEGYRTGNLNAEMRL